MRLETDDGFRDYRYYEERGWFESDYYYPAALGVVKKRAGKLFDAVFATRGERARIFSSREYTASKMTSILRGLDFLVTARYHACVLSMAAHVPQIAVGHDLRLRTIYAELELQDLFVECTLGHRLRLA